MATFSIPKSPAKEIINIDSFEGVDFTNSPANISDNKSPNAINMIRDVPGKVRKRMGYELIKDFGNSFNRLPVTLTTTTLDDVTATVTEGNITLSGTAATDIDFMVNEDCLLEKGSYILAYKVANGYEVRVTSDDEEVDLSDLKQDTHVKVVLHINEQTTLDDITLDLMIVETKRYESDMEYEKYFHEDNACVNGYHFRNKEDTPLYHVGTKLYKDGNVIYSDMANEISHSWAFNDNLYIIDGYKMLKYDGTTVTPIENNGYIPTLTIAKAPNGGGTQYEDFNLLCDGFTELFLGTATDTQYHMTFGDLNTKTVQAYVMDSNGDFIEKTEGTDFTVDRANGIITFTHAPGVSPLTGEDNVKITAYRDVEGYADRINHCTFGTRFGVNGAFDRLFLSGNPEFPNADWYSQQWDATYFPDTGYSLLGSSQSAVKGYSIISNYLAAHKDELEKDLSIIIREGDLVENEPSFKIINTLQGAGAIASNSFAYLRTEPLFLTRNGLFAVTAQDITGEKYAQSRSFFLNGQMMEEDYEKLTKSRAIIFNDMYLLTVDNNLYVLDGLQPIRTDRSEPYATRQYAGFYCDNLPINYMWEWENRLYFGTKEGKIFRFFKDKEATSSYNDDGEPIEAIWETADFEGKYFYKNKSFRYLAVKLGAAVATSIKILGMRKGVWSGIKEDNTKGRFFSYAHLIYSKFSYSTDTTERIVSTKTSIKKVDKARFRFVNDMLNEPFSLFSYAIEYTQNNNVKG